MGLPVLDVASNPTIGSGTSFSWTHTTTSSANRILLVGVYVGSATANATGVTYNSVAMTQISTSQTIPNAFGGITFWYLKAPTTGANTIAVTLAASSQFAGGAVSFSNVDQTTPIGTANSATGSVVNSSSVAVTATTSAYVCDCIGVGTATITVGGSQTQDYQQEQTLDVCCIAASHLQGNGGSTTMTWTLGTSKSYAAIAVPVNGISSSISVFGDGLGGRQI